MPPDLDVYGLTTHRDFETVSGFINQYTNRLAIEDRGDEQLMIQPLVDDSTSELEPDWEPAKTVSNIIKRGLDYPRRCFTVYLESEITDIDSIILSFTEDDQVIIGFSIDDSDESPETLIKAKMFLRKIGKEFRCHLGLIAVELPPPINEEQFKRYMKSKEVIFSETFNI